MSWHDDAACKGRDPAIFTPWDPSARPSEMDPAKAERAKRICALCPVRDACLEAALDEDDGHAVRGGLTPVERRGIGSESSCPVCHASFPSFESLASHMRTHPAQCGTNSGYHRHRRAGEKPCDACREAQNIYRREWRRTGRAKVRGQQPCGTEAGYRRHRRNGEEACEACKAANAVAGSIRKDRARRAS